MKVKRRKYTPPEADLIRPAITGNIVALFDRHHESPAESDDGDRLLRHAPVRGQREKWRGRAASSDGGQPHPGRCEAVLIRG